MYIKTHHIRIKKGVKKIRYLFIGLFLFCLILCQMYAQKLFVFAESTQNLPEKPSLKLYAASAVLIDADNNRILYEKNANEIMPMASTTKIMTAILALENGNPDDIVEISQKAASMPKVHLGVRKGEKYYLKDLMNSLMLESHNDSAVAIAEHIGGSMEGFSEMMNQKARDLGCGQTFFVTPNGLDAEAGGRAHATTAYELAEIAAYAVKNEDFRSLINTRYAEFCEINSGRRFSVSNKNRFLDMTEGAFGIKTGFTNKAGYCFVGAAERNGITLICVVLACGWPPHKEYKWTDSKTLMNFGFENYEIRAIEHLRLPDSVPVERGLDQNVGISMEDKDISLALCEWDDVRVSLEMKDKLYAPVQKDEVIGYEKILLNGELYRLIPIRTTAAVREYTYGYCFGHIYESYLKITSEKKAEKMQNLSRSGADSMLYSF